MTIPAELIRRDIVLLQARQTKALSELAMIRVQLATEGNPREVARLKQQEILLAHQERGIEQLCKDARQALAKLETNK